MTDEPLVGTIRDLFGRVVYSHKTHEKERERLTRFGIAGKWVNVALSAVTLGGFLTAFASGTAAYLWLSIGLGTANVAWALVQVSFDPLRSADAHRQTARRLLDVRDRYEVLIGDIMSASVSDADARTRRDALQEEASSAFALAPDTSPTSYRRAQKALQVNEDMTFSDSEVDAFLPKSLRASGD